MKKILIAFFLLFLFAGCQKPSYTISFESNGGTSVASFSLEADEEIPVFEIPTKEGYVFAGWYLNSSFSEKCEFTVMPEENLRLYAKWIEEKDNDEDSEDFLYTVNNNEVTITGLKKENPNPVIPESIAGMPVVAIEHAFTGNKNLLSVQLPEGLKKIGDQTFDGCLNLKSVTIPSTVTEIGVKAFNNCQSLLFLYLPENVITIKNDPFISCYEMVLACEIASKPEGWSEFNSIPAIHWDIDTILTTVDFIYTVKDGKAAVLRAVSDSASITVDRINDYEVNTIGSFAFGEKYFLKEIFLSEGIKTIGKKAFFGCKELLLVHLSETVEMIEKDVFLNSYEAVILAESPLKPAQWADNWNSSRPTHWGVEELIFHEGCYYAVKDNKMTLVRADTGLVSSEIPSDIDGTEVVAIGDYAFNNCSSLLSVTIPSSVTKIGNFAFANCRELPLIFLPATVAEVGDTLFDFCSNLVIVVEHNIQPEEWSSIWNAIPIPVNWGVEELKTNDQFSYAIVNDTITIIRGKSEITELNIPSEIEGIDVTRIGGGAFRGTDLVTAVLPNSIVSIGRSAFSSCSDLSSITLSNQISAIEDYTFYGTNLTSITLPESVRTIGYCAFYKCQLTEVVIPEGVTSIGDYAFQFCSSLTSVQIPNTVTDLGKGAFGNCVSLETVVLSASLKVIEDYSFGQCSSLKTIVIPDGVTEIKQMAFYFCTSLETIVLPASVTKFGKEVFVRCTSLKSINLPNGLKEISDSLFSSCSALEQIEIPESVEKIGGSAFNNCASLQTVVIRDTVIEVGFHAFFHCPELTVNCESGSLPSGWHPQWIEPDATVIWNYQE